MADLTLPAVYRRAAEVLDERGWHQGYYVDSDGQRVCLAGAVAVACGGRPTPEHTPERTIVWSEPWGPAVYNDALEGLIDANSGRGLASWNDSPRRTVADVKALLLKAAEQGLSDGD